MGGARDGVVEGGSGYRLRSLVRVLGLLVPHGTLVVGVSGYLLLSVLCELSGPLILGGSIDIVLALAGGDSPLRGRLFEEFAIHGAAFLVVGLLGQALSVRKEVLRTRLGTLVLAELRGDFYDSVQRLSPRVRDGCASGDLLGRATRDIEVVHEFHSETLFLVLEALALIVGAAALVAILDWRLAALSFSTLPVALFVLGRAGARRRRRSREANREPEAVPAFVEESIALVRVNSAIDRGETQIEGIKIEGAKCERSQCERARSEGAESGEDDVGASGVEDADREVRCLPEVDVARARGSVRNPSHAATIFSVSLPLALLGGAIFADGGSLRVGTIAAVIFLLARVSNEIRLLDLVFETVEGAASGAERLFAILDAESDIRERASPLYLTSGGPGEVRLEDVHFAYRPDRPVLRGVNLHIRGGECIAIVGPTGCGKSSLANLLPRFRDVDAGRISVDGVDVRKLRLDELRAAVKPIFQDTFLFSLSIADNIAYGRPDAPRDEIERCAAAAQIHDFIAGLEKGYDTIVGRRGMSLSAGERQRISIARALLADPRVLVMDDCTASVDPETEQKLRLAAAELSRGRTTIIIAQRLSSIARADRVVYLESGLVVAEGPHEELLTACPAYARFCSLEARGVSVLQAESARS